MEISEIQPTLKTTTAQITTGEEFVIREATGADDEILTSSLSDKDLEAFHRYLGALIVKAPWKTNSHVELVKSLPIRDKYLLLIQARVLSFGPELSFFYEWPNGYRQEYTIDLHEYYTDYRQFDPNAVSSTVIKPYPTRKPEFKVGDQQFRFKLLDGYGESYILSLPMEKRHVNTILMARNLEIYQGEWKPIKNYGAFSSRVLAEVRKHVRELDPPFDVNVPIQNPQTLQVEQIPLLDIPDFYFPGGTM